MNKLTMEELENTRDEVFEFVTWLRTLRIKLFQAKKIDHAGFLSISRDERKLLDITDDLTIGILKAIVTDIQKPGEKIKDATRKVKDAIAKLQEVNEILGILASTINLFSTIVTAIATGNPAQIATILKQIDTLTS